MTLEFETMLPAGKWSDACELAIMDLRPYVGDDVLGNIPRYFGRWEDGNTQELLLEDNYGETAAEGACDFVVFSSETLECTIVIPNQDRIAAGVDNVDYMQFLTKFCKAKRIFKFPTLFNSDGSFREGEMLSDQFLEYIFADLRKRYMQKLRSEAWNGTQAGANSFAGILTQFDAGPVSSGDGCELYEPVRLDWGVQTGAGATTPTAPEAVIDAAHDILTIRGEDFDGLEGKNLVDFLVLWMERLMEHDLAGYSNADIMFELWVGRGQTTCIAELAACMQPCDGCVNPMSDPLIRDRSASFRKNKVIWLYPYDEIPIVIRTSPELGDRMILVPKLIGGAPSIAWVFRDQAEQVAILNGEMPYYGAEGGALPDENTLYPTDEVDDEYPFPVRAFSINVQKNGNCIDYWINSESVIVLSAWHLWLDITYVDCNGLVPERVYHDEGVAVTVCGVVDADTLDLTVAALEDYGAVAADDTYAVYGSDGVTVLIGTVVGYNTGTDVLTLDFAVAVDCDTGGGMVGATVVKLAEN